MKPLGRVSGYEADVTAKNQVLLFTEADDIVRKKTECSSLDPDIQGCPAGDPGFVFEQAFIDSPQVLDVEFAERDAFPADAGPRSRGRQVEHDPGDQAVGELGGIKDASFGSLEAEKVASPGRDVFPPADPGEAFVANPEKRPKAAPERGAVLRPGGFLEGEDFIEESLSGIDFAVDRVVVEAGVAGFGVKDEEDPIEAGESGIAVKTEAGFVEVERRSEPALSRGVLDQPGDQGLGRRKNSAFEVFGDFFGVSPALPLDFLPSAVFERFDGGFPGGKAPGFRIPGFAEETLLSGYFDKLAGSLFLFLDFANPVCGVEFQVSEHPVGQCFPLLAQLFCAQGKPSCRFLGGQVSKAIK